MPASIKFRLAAKFPVLYRHYRRLKERLGAPEPADLRQAYPDRVQALLASMPEDEAMAIAVGGDYEFMGAHLVEVLTAYGLRPDDYLIDVGCGSGRVATALSRLEMASRLRYLGVDISEELLRYARRKCGIASWRFVKVDRLMIPEKDQRADFVCFFSVFTHLMPEESFLYLQEARRVLKPGGTVVFTFFDFAVPEHWPLFVENIRHLETRTPKVLDMFLSRDAAAAWAQRLGLRVTYIGSPDGGQTRCVLRKPA